jgi:hypothetical protein
MPIFVAPEEAPNRAATAGTPSLVHRRDDFTERHVQVPNNQHKQKTPRALPTGCIHLIVEFGLRRTMAASRGDPLIQPHPQLARITPNIKSMA